MPNSTLERAQLNKVYRAVHDLVCPSCGHDMARLPIGFLYPGQVICANCSFYVTDEEMDLLAEQTVPEWGAKLITTFYEWRKSRIHRILEHE